MQLSSLINEVDSLRRFGLIVERRADGVVRANVAHVRYHSPTGIECGYLGSGPADLALSVMHELLPPLPEEQEEAQYALASEAFARAIDDPARWSIALGTDGVRVSLLAYRLHQSFKEQFISRMPSEGGYVPIRHITHWIETKRAQLLTEA